MRISCAVARKSLMNMLLIHCRNCSEIQIIKEGGSFGVDEFAGTCNMELDGYLSP